jgi:hypothetical protein
MFRATPLVIWGLLIATALAAGDIPTRYSGSFPSVGALQSITGVYAGATLSLKATFVQGTRFTDTAGQFSCARTSDTRTRCGGRFVDQYGGSRSLTLTITWANGMPVAMTKGG